MPILALADTADTADTDTNGYQCELVSGITVSSECLEMLVVTQWERRLRNECLVFSSALFTESDGFHV